MTSTVIPVKTLKKFGGIRFINAVEGAFSEGYNFESFPAKDDGFGFRRMLGNTLVKQYPDSELCGTFESIQNGTKYHFVYLVTATEGIVALWNGTNFVSKVTGLSKTAKHCKGIDFNNKFFFTNGSEKRTIQIGASPEVVTINTVDALSRTHNGLGLWVYDNRIWLASQYGVVACANGLETDWASTGDAGAFYKNYYEPLKFVHGFSSGIIFGNGNFTDYISGTGAENYNLEPLGTTGAVGHNAICAHENNVYIFNGEGIYPVEYINTGERKISDKISIRIDDALKNVDKNKYDDVQLISVADAGENKIWFHARFTDYETNSVIWQFDFNTLEWFRRIQQPINYLSINDYKIHSAGVSGDLLQENMGETFNGDYIPALARLSLLDFGSAAQLKKIKKVLCMFTEGSVNDFYLRYVYNGDPSDFKEEIISEDFGEVFVLADDDEAYGGILADDEETYGNILDNLVSLIMNIFRPAKKFYTLQLEFSCREPGQNFDIERIEFQRVKIKI